MTWQLYVPCWTRSDDLIDVMLAAAEAVGMSLDSFERHAQADLKLIRRGRLRLVPVAELERWVRENAEPSMREEIA
jgi:hypothetical protein